MRPAFLSFATAVLAFSLLCCPLTLAQQAEGSIVGTLQVARGFFPDHSIMVTLTTRGQTVSVQYADDEGKFYFPNLVTNIYHITIKDDKFRPVDMAVNLNTAIQTNQYIHITLEPIADAPHPGQPTGTIQGANPNLVSTVDLSRKYPKDVIKEFDQGVKAEQDGKIDEAKHHYEKAIQKAPEFYPARNNLGSIYLGKSDFGRAQKQFEEAIRLNPNDGSGYFNLANVMLLTNRADDAIRTAREGLGRQPNSGFGYLVLGSALAKQGQGADAERALRRALELDPSQNKAHLELVNLYLRYGQRQGAITELKVFLKSAPDDPFASKAREVLAKLEAQSKHQAKH